MRVEHLMSRAVATCRPDETLDQAARHMWQRRCGCVPVVDEHGIAIGMVTDRDVCMAALREGRPLTAIRVRAAMSPAVYACRPDDSIAHVEALMRARHVHRLAVLDGAGRLVGLLSLTDLARAADGRADAPPSGPIGDAAAPAPADVGVTLRGIREPPDGAEHGRGS